MPALSGIETLRELHRLMSWLPVIAMTADRDLWVREDVVAAGAFDLLWKPLRRAEVMGALDRALRALPPEESGGDPASGRGARKEGTMAKATAKPGAKVRPLGDKVLIKRLEAQERSKAGSSSPTPPRRSRRRAAWSPSARAASSTTAVRWRSR